VECHDARLMRRLCVGLTLRALWIAQASFVLVCPAAAQDRLDRLRPYQSQVVFVETASGPEILVRLVGVTDDRVMVTVGGTPQEIPWPDIVKVSRSSNNLHKGVVIGAAVGARLGVLATQGNACSQCLWRDVGAVAVSASVLTAIGAWIGANHRSRTILYEKGP
jgi:hypothetical protein